MRIKWIASGVVFLSLLVLISFSFLNSGNAAEFVSGGLPENRVKIAVIDTGMEMNPYLKPFLCRGGHTSFVDDAPISDGHRGRHGTNVAGLIADNLDPKKHCLLIIKFYSQYLGSIEFKDFVRMGIEYAITQNVQYINLSLGGPDSMFLEYLSIEKALRLGIKVSVAAGNDGKDLDKKCYYYPACYDFKVQKENFRVVGSKGSRFSNRGKIVKFWEDGNDVGVPLMSGTSQATAIQTGKWVKADSK